MRFRDEFKINGSRPFHEMHKSTWTEVDGKPSSFTPSAHSHDDKYFTEAEMNTKLAAKADINGTHLSLTSGFLKIRDIRGTAPTPDSFTDHTISAFFNDHSTYGGSWQSGITVKGWSNNYQVWQLSAGSTLSRNENLYFRTGIGTTWGSLREVFHTGHLPSWGEVDGKPTTFAPTSHTHDDRYYTESEMNTKLNLKFNNTGGTLNGNFAIGKDLPVITLRQTVDKDVQASIRFEHVNGQNVELCHRNFDGNPRPPFGLLIRRAASNPDSGLKAYLDVEGKIYSEGGDVFSTVHLPTWGEVDGKPSSFTPSSHTHDDRYFTESEINSRFTGTTKASTYLGTSNLNDIKTEGTYYQHANANTSGKNYPSEKAGSLSVFRAAGVVQVYRIYATSDIYVRSYYTSWSNWKAQVTNGVSSMWTEGHSKTSTWGCGASDIYINNSKSGKFLQLKDSGTLNYDGALISSGLRLQTELKNSNDKISLRSSKKYTLNDFEIVSSNNGDFIIDKSNYNIKNVNQLVEKIKSEKKEDIINIETDITKVLISMMQEIKTLKEEISNFYK